MQKGDDAGKFRQLDEILFIDGYPGYQHLLPVLEKSINIICEVKGCKLKLPHPIHSSSCDILLFVLDVINNAVAHRPQYE